MKNRTQSTASRSGPPAARGRRAWPRWTSQSTFAVGDSLTAGYASGGLAQFYQVVLLPGTDRSPGELGRQFQQPIVSNPGINPVLMLQGLKSRPVLVPLFRQRARIAEQRDARRSPYNNLGIPGANVGDLLTKTGDTPARSREPRRRHGDVRPRSCGTSDPGALAQAIGAAGTFYTVWIGNNDVLGAAL